jgi:2,4-dienoyl-CoA reductase-like NADH-dependent reductase (Old Yellow Enzyme family)/thioredoxin reductase
MFEGITLGGVELPNRFVFPPIKLAYGSPDGTVTSAQLTFYRQMAQEGPGLLILEPVSVTPEGKEHPKQLCVHLPESQTQLKKIVDVIHGKGRLACLHLNHAGAAANPMATKTQPKAPSSITCQASGQESKPLDEEEIAAIIEGYRTAAQKAAESGFDVIEVQAGHGYLVSQFLNKKINQRNDAYGPDRLLFSRQVLSAVREGARDIPFIVRISGNEMSPEFGISTEDLLPFLKLAKDAGACAVHVGMGHACFSPPWYFHHGSLPEKPQMDALRWVREHTSLLIIAAGRMGRQEKVRKVLDDGLTDLVALGRPLIADHGLIEKWRGGTDRQPIYCGYCLQGCLHRVKSGEGIGCNVNPEVGQPELGHTENPMNILVAGGGPAGMSAALHLSQRGHRVTLAEKEDRLGGQFGLAWQAPGKENMKATLDSFERSLWASYATVLTGREADAALVREIRPDLLVWATGAVQNIPEIPGLENQHSLTSIDYFTGEKEIRGPRVLVIGAGRTGLEIAEKLGREGFEVVATKRTDPVGSMMELITKNLTLKRIGETKNIMLMPHTTVKAFMEKSVDIEQDGVRMSLEPFQSVILASGMLSAQGPEEEIGESVSWLEVIGDARDVRDIFSATQAGYRLALSY